jgi:hypothetical protein
MRGAVDGPHRGPSDRRQRRHYPVTVSAAMPGFATWFAATRALSLRESTVRW